MRKKIILGALSLSVFTSSLLALSLRDSVEIALNNNPDIIAERKNQDGFRKYVDDREGLYFPTIDIEAYAKVGEEKSDDNANPNVWNKEDGYNAAIIFRQYLYDGGQTPSQVTETKHQYLSNKYRSLYSIENTILETVKNYNTLVQYDERIALSESMIKIHEENLAIAKEKEEISGEVLETFQVASKLHFVTDRFIEEQDLKEEQIAKYRMYVGKDLGNETVCRPTIDETKVPSTLKDAIEIAVLRNYKIKEQIENIKKQREKIAQYDARFLPSLNLELKASIDEDLELNEEGTTQDRYARLVLDWNLYNGNRDSIRSQQETLFLQEQKKLLDNVTNEIVAEITSLFSKYNKNKKRVEVLKKYVNANVNIVEVYRNEFETGTRTFIDILDAESELYNSSQSLINMEYATLNSYYDLMFNLAQLSDAILLNPNQDCANVEPRIIDYTPKKQDKQTQSELDDLISTDDSAMIKRELGLDIDTAEVPLTIKSDETKEQKSFANNGFETFLEAPKNYFTINVGTKKGLNAAKNYVALNSLSSSAFVFDFGKNLQNAKVLYGIYPSIKEAKNALKSFSEEVLAKKPYIDNISKHQALYNKYHK